LFNPTYLQRSRHGIFYFRWTLARPSEGDQSTSIRLSLRTREPRQALQLAMPLSYLARNFTIKGQRHGMDHKQLRAVLIDHFGRFLAAHKAKIDANGPLSDKDRTLLESTVGIAEMELEFGPLNETDTDRNTVEFIRRYDLGIDPGSSQFDVLKRSISQAHRDYAKSVLAYSLDVEQYDFAASTKAEPLAVAKKLNARTLEWLVDEFWKFAKIENRWAHKTEADRHE
jgi:hypothetical protein